MPNAFNSFLSYLESDAKSPPSFYIHDLSPFFSILSLTTFPLPTSRNFDHTILLTVSLTHWVFDSSFKEASQIHLSTVIPAISHPVPLHCFALIFYDSCNLQLYLLFTYLFKLLLSKCKLLEDRYVIDHGVFTVLLFQGSIIDHELYSELYVYSSCQEQRLACFWSVIKYSLYKWKNKFGGYKGLT